MTENEDKRLTYKSRDGWICYKDHKSQSIMHVGGERMEITEIILLFTAIVGCLLGKQLKCYEDIGTIEEFEALKEKSVAKKPNQVVKAMDKDKYVGLIGRCPNCGSIVTEDNLVCEDCFQVLDWSE